MKEAGFLPNVSLNVIVASPPPPVVAEEHIDEHMEEQPDEFNMDDMEDSDVDDEFVSVIDRV